MTVRDGVALLGMLVSLALPPQVAAQNEAGALAAVDQVFEGMRTANASMVREVFAADAAYQYRSEVNRVLGAVVSSVKFWR